MHAFGFGSHLEGRPVRGAPDLLHPLPLVDQHRRGFERQVVVEEDKVLGGVLVEREEVGEGRGVRDGGWGDTGGLELGGHGARLWNRHFSRDELQATALMEKYGNQGFYGI